MCGIAGKVSASERPEAELGERFLDCLDNRGPDDSGVYSSSDAVLSHRRLSILDRSSAGHQPMANDDETLWIVFNGEIYNYRELRERVSGPDFKSGTDTEVLLRLYEEYGVDCLEHLRGMFAFAIWDEQRGQLFLARDRLGQKPLFVRREDDTFWFGSTIRAILEDDDVTAVPDEQAIRQFLTYQYVPAPRTGFRGIEQLRPAEYAVVRDGSVQRDQYWRPTFKNKFDASPNRLGRVLREHLRDAVRLRLRSDVPLGVYLSGGIDSAIVTALAAQESDSQIRTFSIGFDEQEYDERDYARAVAEQYGTDHREFTVTPSATDDLETLVEHFEMPFGDPSALPTYHVSRIATDQTTVALTGDAGDENFAGYDRYAWDRLVSAVKVLPQNVRSGIRMAIDALPDFLSYAQLARHARRFLDATDRDEVGQYAAFICHALDDQVGQVWRGSMAGEDVGTLRAAFERADGPTRLDRVQQVDIETYLPDDLLVKADRMSMAHSVEVRSPFLDHRLVEFAARIPSRYKFRRGTKKWLLKESCRDLLPASVYDRSKQGFGIPVHEWFRGSLLEDARERLERLGQRPRFDGTGIDSTLDRHVAGRIDVGHHLWDLLVLELWYERFIDDS